ncbi:MAG: hypothetical protein OXJ37_14255 [Bryobacterales bacterium]|nr:hypothetical protein [Bryobacterales bacterium]
MPDKIDASAEELAQAMFALPEDYDFKLPKQQRSKWEKGQNSDPKPASENP